MYFLVFHGSDSNGLRSELLFAPVYFLPWSRPGAPLGHCIKLGNFAIYLPWQNCFSTNQNSGLHRSLILLIVRLLSLLQHMTKIYYKTMEDQDKKKKSTLTPVSTPSCNFCSARCTLQCITLYYLYASHYRYYFNTAKKKSGTIRVSSVIVSGYRSTDKTKSNPNIRF